MIESSKSKIPHMHCNLVTLTASCLYRFVIYKEFTRSWSPQLIHLHSIELEYHINFLSEFLHSQRFILRLYKTEKSGLRRHTYFPPCAIQTLFFRTNLCCAGLKTILIKLRSFLWVKSSNRKKLVLFLDKIFLQKGKGKWSSYLWQ